MALYLILIGQSWYSVVSYFRLSMALLYISEWYLSISSWVTETDASFTSLKSHCALALVFIQTQLVQYCDSISDCSENNDKIFSEL